MAFYIAVYDIGQKRCVKMLKIFRKYMTWVQNSVFEGEMTDSQKKRLAHEAKEIMDLEYDSVIFYRMGGQRYLTRTILGQDKGKEDNFL